MPEQQIKLSYAGSVTLPKGTTAPIEGTDQKIEVSELSGLEFFPESGTIRAVGDKAKSAEKNPVDGAKAQAPQNAVFDFDFKLTDGKLALTPIRATPVDVQKFAADREQLAKSVPPGSFIPSLAWDTEDLVQLDRDRTLVMLEGFDEKHKPGMASYPRIGSGIAIVERDGRISGMLPLPDALRPVEGEGAEAGKLVSGQRSNLGLEAAGATQDRKTLFVGMEGALVQDGPLSTLDSGSTVRVLRYSQDSAGQFSTEPKQIRYSLEKIPTLESAPLLSAKCDNGLVDLLPIDSKRFLAMERATLFYEDGRVRNSVRIYDVALNDDMTIASKTEAFNSQSLETQTEIEPSPAGTAQPGKLAPGGQRSENFEGLCFGPKTADGAQTVLLIGDDNARDNQRTILVMLKVEDNGRNNR